jgi:anti-sigma regulatory factor (Ser/Thr protein kinase)
MIVVDADGTTRPLEDGHTIALGVRPNRPRPEARITMPARATLLMYTDGLVERRRRSLDDGIARACALIRKGRDSGLEDLADQVMTRLAPGGGYQDDVALLLYRHPAPLHIKFAADANHLAATRAALRQWLMRAQIPPELARDVLLAAGEAVANAIEHGYRQSSAGVIHLSATALPDEVHVSIVDSGSWKPPRPSIDRHRGRGIALMRALMHDVTINSVVGGTTVRLSVRIS